MKILLSILAAISWFSLFCQVDSVRMKENEILIISDSLFVAKQDTILLLPRGTKYQFANNRYVVNKKFYNNIYSKAQKNRITKELYNLLVTERPPQEPQKTSKPVRSESFYEAFKNKTIRSIEFYSVDILDGNVNDTTKKARSSLSRLSNKLHNDTRQQIIRNYLLFKPGDRVDPFAIADTERIVRALSYIEDVRIKLVVNPDDLNTADAIIIYKDRFPWNLNFSLDSDRAFELGFTNRNVLGTGQEFGVGYFYSRTDEPNHGYDLQYTVRGIQNDPIDGTIYTSDNYLGRRTGISFRRDFVSPEIKYYGEVALETERVNQDLVFADSLYEENFPVSRNSYDVWAGRSFQVGKRSAVNLAARLNHDDYLSRPEVQLDSNEIYHDHHLLLGALSFNKITFLKARNILAFNITEDIPEGYLFSVLYGRDWNEFDPRTYRGVRANYSNYTRLGYITLNLEAGFFRNQGKTRNEVIELQSGYFTPLFSLGNATSRLFTRFYYFEGNDLSIPQSQSLEGINRIRNIEGRQIRGNRVLTMANELVIYQPWYYYGFRFATYAHAGIGAVEETRSTEPYQETYYNFGGGIRIRNESLVFDTFEFRFSLYPNPPLEGNVFTFNISLISQTFFRSPNIRKPRIVGIN